MGIRGNYSRKLRIEKKISLPSFAIPRKKTEAEILDTSSKYISISSEGVSFSWIMILMEAMINNNNNNDVKIKRIGLSVFQIWSNSRPSLPPKRPIFKPAAIPQQSPTSSKKWQHRWSLKLAPPRSQIQQQSLRPFQPLLLPSWYPFSFFNFFLAIGSV